MSKTPAYFQPNHPSLEGEVAAKAVSNQITYPQVVRTQNDPPVINQVFGNMSFMLFSQPRILSTGKPVYGFVKMRGNWPDQHVCETNAANIVKQTDSKFKVRVVPVGAWIPITEEDGAAEMIDVKTSDSAVQLRDQAIRDMETKQRQMIREIRDREDELRNTPDIYEEPNSVRYYAMKRVTEMRLCEAIEAEYKKIEDLKKKLVQVRTECRQKEKEFPKHSEEWLDSYNKERRKAGIPDFVPSENQFDEYNKFQL